MNARITFYYHNESRLSFDTTMEEAKRIKKQYSTLLRFRQGDDEEENEIDDIAETEEFSVDLSEVLAVNVIPLTSKMMKINEIRTREVEVNLMIGEAQLKSMKKCVDEEWKSGDEE